jgi:oligoendopeptidase F
MSEIENFLFTWIPVFVVLSIIVIGLLKYAKIRASYKVTKLKQGKIQQKESESFSGAINEMIDSAPKNLAQVESEIMTIRQEAIKKGMTEEQVKPLLARLESEKDLLKLASKYGHLAKPLGGSVGKILEKVLGGIGN